jgi:hypothetical protein
MWLVPMMELRMVDQLGIKFFQGWEMTMAPMTVSKMVL